MQIGSRRVRLVVAGATIAWLIGVVLVRGGAGTPMHAAEPSASPSHTKAERGAVFSPACGRPEYVLAGAQAASPQKPQ
jgi:hypothetical protein